LPLGVNHLFRSGPAFGYKAENIVEGYLNYMRFMEHWRSVLPANRFLEIDYETLVDSSDETIRKLIDCLELPWEDGCLNHQKRGKTPS